MSADVVNNATAHRFELEVDGQARGSSAFDRTGGKGVGSKLVKGALEQVRRDGLKVVPDCPFVKAYIEKHPEQADLLA